MKRNFKITLPHQLAIKWKALLKSPDMKIPSVRELARREDISPGTAHKILLQLREWDLITIERSRRGRLSRTGQTHPGIEETIPVSSGDSNAVEKLAARLRGGIELGAYRVGDPFPRFKVLHSGARSSKATLTAAFRKLAAAKLAHKRGRAWIVGPTPPQAEPSSLGFDAEVGASLERPIILVLCHYHRKWQSICGSVRIRAFGEEFQKECHRHGMGMRIVVTDPQLGGGIFPAGEEEIRRCILDMGNRYLGALIASQPDELTDMASWIGRLARHGRPVVAFDANDLGVAGLRPGMGPGQFYRCHFNEPEAINLALKVLARAGHTHVGFPIPLRTGNKWPYQRADLLVRQAQRLDLDFKLIVADRNRLSPSNPLPKGDTSMGGFWNSTLTSHLTRLLDPIGAGKPANDLHRILNRANEVMPDLMGRGGFSAFLAPNDASAALIFFWLTAKGYKVPGDFSMLSFDNSTAACAYPISSIDFGFGELGYSAFHLIAGIVPIKSDRYGNVPAQPDYFDRGSVTPIVPPIRPPIYPPIDR